MGRFKIHIPVMSEEVKSFINPKKNGRYFDATFGQGGYTKKLIENSGCTILAIDRDPSSKNFALKLMKKFQKKFYFKNERFSNLDIALKYFKQKKIDGITFDLGLSNTQMDSPERGFSFTHDGPLDMRMNDSLDNELTAEIIINDFSEEDLSNIFYKFGEERNSYKIARAIIHNRKHGRIKSTKQLSDIVKKVKMKNSKINPSTKIFQALRIFINKELEELEVALNKTIPVLNKNSRIVVVSFHSLEDRIVKKFMRKNSGYATNNYKHLPEKEETKIKPKLKILTKKPILPSFEEIKTNPRARSAKLRAAEKI